MNRTIDLVRYRRYGEDLLLLEQLTATTAKPAAGTAAATVSSAANGSAKKYKTVTQQIAEAPPALLDLYHAVSDHLQAAGDDVQLKPTDFYIAFRRLKNFGCVELRNQIGKLSRVRTSGPRQRSSGAWLHPECARHRSLRHG